jgi:hypothetical protein
MKVLGLAEVSVWWVTKEVIEVSGRLKEGSFVVVKC